MKHEIGIIAVLVGYFVALCAVGVIVAILT